MIEWSKEEIAADESLLPCPFCGSRLTLTKYSWDVEYTISCTECSMALEGFNSLEEAVEACNKRVGVQQ